MPRGNKRSKEAHTLKDLIALLQHNDVKSAYRSRHPNAKESTIRSNAYKMVTPELLAELRKVIAIDPKIQTTRFTLERFLYGILAKYTSGATEVKTSDAIKVCELLSKLVPEFKDRVEVDDMGQMSVEEIDRKIKELGTDLPSSRN